MDNHQKLQKKGKKSLTRVTMHKNFRVDFGHVKKMYIYYLRRFKYSFVV